jgi:hypothetical protein
MGDEVIVRPAPLDHVLLDHSLFVPFGFHPIWFPSHLVSIPFGMAKTAQSPRQTNGHLFA